MACIKVVTALISSQTQSVPRRISREVLQSGGQTAFICGTKGRDLHITLPVGSHFERLVFLKQTVEVAATKTERADTGPAGMVAARDPGAGFGVDIEW